jgi:hypothetical protein
LGASIALKLSGVGGMLKQIPPKVWYALAAIAALAGAYFLHQHHAHSVIAAAKTEQKKADDAAWQAAFAKMHEAAAKWKVAAELNGQTIAQRERKLNDEEHSRNAARADDLRLHGPGKAAGCRPVDHPGLAAVSSGRNKAAPVADAAGREVPATDWALVPWGWLVDRAKEHDDLLADEQTRRAADAEQRAAWEKMRQGHGDRPQ